MNIGAVTTGLNNLRTLELSLQVVITFSQS
jgi:hypothetical protein